MSTFDDVHKKWAAQFLSAAVQGGASGTTSPTPSQAGLPFDKTGTAPGKNASGGAVDSAGPTSRPRPPGYDGPPPDGHANAPVAEVDVIASYQNKPESIQYSQRTAFHEDIWVYLGHERPTPVAYRVGDVIRVDIERFPAQRLSEIGIPLRSTPNTKVRPGGTGPSAPGVEQGNTQQAPAGVDPKATTAEGQPPAPPAPPAKPASPHDTVVGDTLGDSVPKAGPKTTPWDARVRNIEPIEAVKMSQTGDNVYYSESSRSHQQGWENLHPEGEAGTAPIAYQVDNDVYVDMSRWPRTELVKPVQHRPRGTKRVAPQSPQSPEKPQQPSTPANKESHAPTGSSATAHDSPTPATSPAAPPAPESPVAAKGGGEPIKGGTPPASPPPDVPKTGNIKEGRVTVNYDFTGKEPSVTLKELDLKDYPPDKQGKITGLFKDRVLLGGLVKAGANFAAGQAADKMMEVVQSHFHEELAAAKLAFADAYPTPGQLRESLNLDELKETYQAIVDYVKEPANAIANRKIPKDLANNLQGAFEYEKVLTDLQEHVQQLTIGLPELGDDIDARSHVLLDIKENLEKAFAYIHTHLIGAIEVVYYQSFTLWSARGTFEALGHEVGGFANTIHARFRQYEELSEKLDKKIVEVNNELEPWRELYEKGKAP